MTILHYWSNVNEKAEIRSHLTELNTDKSLPPTYEIDDCNAC